MPHAIQKIEDLNKSYFHIKIGRYKLIGYGINQNGNFTGLMKNAKNGQEFEGRGFYIGNKSQEIAIFYKEGAIMSTYGIQTDIIRQVSSLECKSKQVDL